jgi:hypothetical protein
VVVRDFSCWTTFGSSNDNDDLGSAPVRLLVLRRRPCDTCTTISAGNDTMDAIMMRTDVKAKDNITVVAVLLNCHDQPKDTSSKGSVMNVVCGG